MDLEDIVSELELKTDTEKIVYLVNILKSAQGENQKVIHDMLSPLVQSKYKRMVERGLIFGVGSLLRLTKIDPVLDKGIILKSYEDLVLNKPSCFAEKALTLYRVTKEKPMVNENIIHSAYEWAIKNERINDFDILCEVTGVAPTEDEAKAIEDLRDSIEKKLAELKKSGNNTEESDMV
ncbi:MAG: hypothetical protein SVJ22_01520 [Halobacteriota archaeon]|nr:hypothetical protein [Halobacteriota archaeon]